MITHVEYSNGSEQMITTDYCFVIKPRKAVGERTPLLILTIIAIPVSRNGIEKSMSRARSEFN
jgi:hypothetical protein